MGIQPKNPHFVMDEENAAQVDGHVHRVGLRAPNRARWLVLTITLISFQLTFASPRQSPTRPLSGTVVDAKGQVLTGVAVIASGVNGEWRTTTNATG
jgi:hypothetical protein